MSKYRTIKLLVGLTIFMVFSYWSVMLWLIPNDYLMLHGISESRTAPENNISRAISFIPKNISLWKVKHTEKGCFGYFSKNKVSHVSLLVDIVFGNFPDEGLIFNEEKAKDLARHFIEMGCGVNETHPVTKWGPIHTAFIAAHKDLDFVIELLEYGADPFLKTPQNMPIGIRGKPAIEIIRAIIKNGKNPNLRIYEQLLSKVESHNKQIQPTLKPRG